MPILIPNRKLVRPTTDIRPKPGTAKSAVKNPCPIGVSATGASSSGTALLEPTTSRDNYVGYNVRSNVAGAMDDENYSPLSGCVIEGFTGVTPGALVYVDSTARPDPEADFSGLTHTAPTVLTGRTAGDAGDVNTARKWDAVGVGWTTTKIYFYAI